MESMMTFLADNYIWFFVAAGILCFALIGFIIEVRRKRKVEFKGESIEEGPVQLESLDNSTELNEAPTNEMLSNSVNDVPEVIEPISFTEQPLESMNNMPNDFTENVNLEDTMEINDIPLANDIVEPEPKPAPIEFYNGPIEMPMDTPKPMPIEDLQDTPMDNSQDMPINNETMGNVIPDNGNISATIFEPTNFEQDTIVSNNESNYSNNENNSNNDTLYSPNVEENKEKFINSNIFDDLN